MVYHMLEFEKIHFYHYSPLALLVHWVQYWAKGIRFGLTPLLFWK